MWLIIFFAWLAFVAWVGATHQGADWLVNKLDWFNPYCTTKGLVFGSEIETRAAEAQRQHDCEYAAAKDRARWMDKHELANTQVTPEEYNIGVDISSHHDLKTNTRVFRMVRPDDPEQYLVEISDEVVANESASEIARVVNEKFDTEKRIRQAKKGMSDYETGF